MLASLHMVKWRPRGVEEPAQWQSSVEQQRLDPTSSPSDSNSHVFTTKLYFFQTEHKNSQSRGRETSEYP